MDMASTSPALLSEKNLSMISMMLDGIERDMEQSRHLVHVKQLRQENLQDTVNYLTRDNLILMDLLKEAEERFEINLQETSATITELKKYYEEKLQTGEGELERIVEQCNTAQRERDHLAKSLQAAEESYQELNKKYLLSERSYKSQTIIIEDLNEQNAKQIEKIKQLGDYCAMLEQSHEEINAYQKDKTAAVKQTMRSEVDRYYQQVSKLEMRVHELEMENAMLKSSQFGREGRSSSTMRSVNSSVDSLPAKSPRAMQQSRDRPYHQEEGPDSYIGVYSSSSRSRSRDSQVNAGRAEQRSTSESPPQDDGRNSRDLQDSDVDTGLDLGYENQPIYFASSGDKFSEDRLNLWDQDDAGPSAWNRLQGLAAQGAYPWDSVTDKPMQRPLETDSDGVYQSNVGLNPVDDSEVTKMVEPYRQLLGNTEAAEASHLPDNLTADIGGGGDDGMAEEEVGRRWARNRVERHGKDEETVRWEVNMREEEVEEVDIDNVDQSNMLLWLAKGASRAVNAVDDDNYNPMDDEEEEDDFAGTGNAGSDGNGDLNLQDLSRLEL